jgi:tetratricopeptide (TPR) repeat protein
MERYQEAIEVHNMTLHLEPENDLTYSNKGQALVFLRKYEEAIEAYDKALQLNPKNHVATNNKGIALYSLKR